METQEINTHNLICDFGRHKGQRYTRMPIGYLQWMVKNMADKPELQAIAQAELDRRGTVTPDMDISHHALDRFSQRHLHLWLEDWPNKEKGIHAYLLSFAKGVFDNKELDDEGKVKHRGITLVFATDSEWPTLITVM